MKYETVVGLEVHVELSTHTKIFCGCENKFGGLPNTYCCPVCAGMPGTLPVLNKKAVEYAVIAGLAVNCEIERFSKMDRKGYFYPDLPKAYQISQFDLPICKNGYIDISINDETKRIRINRIHIEEDAGKLLHGVGGGTAIDCNRGGVPLIEIVTEPDLRSAQEARVFLETLKSIIKYTGVSDCKMQEGSLRCDVNVSVRKQGAKEFGTRVEMKNLNSFSSVYRAINAECKRQIDLLGDGETILQETRRYDDVMQLSAPMREKEEAHDYRYFPDPDLAPIVVSDEMLADCKTKLPELPVAKKERYINELGLSEYDAGVLTADFDIAAFFEECLKLYNEPKKVCNFITSDLLRLLKEGSIAPEDNPATPKQLVEALMLAEQGKVSITVAKTVFEQSFKTGEPPSAIADKKGLEQINDCEKLSAVLKQIIEQNPGPLADYKSGKQKAVTFFIGQAMKATRGQANPQVLSKLAREELDKA